jgi:hypothetical protein
VFHQHIKKTNQEVLENARDVKRKRKLKAERKTEQDENIKKKKKELGVDR